MYSSTLYNVAPFSASGPASGTYIRRDLSGIYRINPETIPVLVPIFDSLEYRELPKQTTGSLISGNAGNYRKEGTMVLSDGINLNTDRPVFEAGIHH